MFMPRSRVLRSVVVVVVGVGVDTVAVLTLTHRHVLIRDHTGSNVSGVAENTAAFCKLIF